MLALAGSIDTSAIRSYVFGPPLYATQYNNDPTGLGRGYIITPNVQRIRTAVAGAFKVDPAAEALREKVSAENATVWVLNGSGAARPGQRHRRLPRVPGRHRQRAQPAARPARPDHDPDRRLQRRRGRHPPDDRAAPGGLRGNGQDGHRQDRPRRRDHHDVGPDARADAAAGPLGRSRSGADSRTGRPIVK